MTHLVIFTGSSRGLGLAMAAQLLQRPATLLLGLARQHGAPPPCAAGSRFEPWAQDLSHPMEASARLQAWLQEQDGEQFDSATLINNAALLTPPGPVEECDTTLLSSSVRVGLEAPMLLTAAFLRATDAWRARRDGRCKVLNISSGLGRRAMAGSAPYCAVKAGLDNFSRAVALDEAQKPHGAKIVSLAPGVIDTDMQAQLRAADEAAFPDKALFVGLKSGGQLASPQQAAARVLAYLDRADYGSNPLADVRDA
jgi:benzil reductase ((S)-benzoin forming)